MSSILKIADVHRGIVKIDKAAGGTLFLDVDGTVADLTHRRVYVATKPKNWPAFEKTMDQDTPIQHVIDAAMALKDAGWTVVIMTGRGIHNKDVTEDWLQRHGVRYDAIYTRNYERDEDGNIVMKKDGVTPKPDYRRDDLVKYDLLVQARKDGYDPTAVFDDRDQVVRMWRANDIFCVQTAFGDF